MSIAGASIYSQQPPEVVIVSIVLTGILFVVAFSKFQSGQRPSSKKLPPLADGTIFETVRAILSSEAPWFVLRNAQKYGFRAFMVNLPKMGFTGDGELARKILTDPTSSKPPQVYKPFDAVVGGVNIFSASTESFRWKHSRKGMAPAFSANNIARMNRICKHVTEQMIQNRLMPAMEEQREVLICQEMLLLTLSTICKGALEYDIGLEESRMVLGEFEIANKEFFQKSSTNPLRRMRAFQWVFPEVCRAKSASSRLQAFALKVLASYRAKHTGEEGNNTKMDTVICLVVENENYESDKDRAADLMTLLLGGTETTAYTLAFTLLALAKHPNDVVQLRTALTNTTEEHWSGLAELRYVIRESMRLHPTGAMGSARILGRDFPINDSDMTIPKGSLIFIAPILLFRNPEVYERPESFLPSRWRTASKLQLDTFRPFAEGKRNCLGQSLANAELHYVIGRLIKDFDFERVNPGRLEYFMTMKPEGATLKIRKVPSILH